ncbi:hypothetical protein VB779_21710 [Haloarculaceae archaeon H-GB11]|nr:hypothetical protein [Haloarculaceae archaeon H-GB11]
MNDDTSTTNSGEAAETRESKTKRPANEASRREVLKRGAASAVTVGLGLAGPAGAASHGHSGEDSDEYDHSEEADVVLRNQMTDGTTIMVDEVDVPEGGFVAIHDTSLLSGAVVESVIGVSDFLEPGEHEDVEITLFDVPGAQFNVSALQETQALIAMPHRDTNDNQVYDFVTTAGEEDGPYVRSGQAVVDVGFAVLEEETPTPEPETPTPEPETPAVTPTPEPETPTPEPETPAITPTPEPATPTPEPETPAATPTPEPETPTPEPETPTPEPETPTPEPETPTPEPETPAITPTPEPATPTPEPETPAATPTPEPETASVEFLNQQTDGSTITVEEVTVPEGGFVAIHDTTLLEGAVVESVIGVSDYLEPGTQQDLEITLFDVPGAQFDVTELQETQVLFAMPHLDTNGDLVYDFVRSNGTDDGPYVRDGQAVIDVGFAILQ